MTYSIESIKLNPPFRHKMLYKDQRSWKKGIKARLYLQDRAETAETEEEVRPPPQFLSSSPPTIILEKSMRRV